MPFNIHNPISRTLEFFRGKVILTLEFLMGKNSPVEFFRDWLF
jgi:hypothetical protein